MLNLLIVEDNEEEVDVLRQGLSHLAHLRFVLPDKTEIKALAGTRFDAAIVDMVDARSGQEKVLGHELVEQLREQQPDILCVFYTAFSHKQEYMDKAYRSGCLVLKRNEWYQDHLIRLIETLLMQHRWYLTQSEKEQAELQHLRGQTRKQYEKYVAVAPASKALFEKVESVLAWAESPVLIYGESGAGKDMIAGRLHCAGPRRNKPFVAWNCRVGPSHLFEADLFGNEKGAFTDSKERKLGKLELADGGTFFIDEIGNMTLEVQEKLLRVIIDKEFERVGGTKPIKVDVRIVAATNADLPTMLEEGRFREDLFYRLNVFQVDVLPLRERKEDIPELVDFFSDAILAKTPSLKKKWAGSAIEKMQSLPWPGNLWQLKAVVERLLNYVDHDTINAEDVAEYALDAARCPRAGRGSYSRVPGAMKPETEEEKVLIIINDLAKHGHKSRFGTLCAELRIAKDRVLDYIQALLECEQEPLSAARISSASVLRNSKTFRLRKTKNSYSFEDVNSLRDRVVEIRRSRGRSKC
jgi:DNA-binding NtrC family response regulator